MFVVVVVVVGGGGGGGVCVCMCVRACMHVCAVIYLALYLRHTRQHPLGGSLNLTAINKVLSMYSRSAVINLNKLYNPKSSLSNQLLLFSFFAATGCMPLTKLR